MILLDTDVMIDVLRRYEPALDWLATEPNRKLGIPGLVMMELLQGCRNTVEQKRLENVLRPYSLFWPTPQDCNRALEDYRLHHLSSGIGIMDALIGETAVGLKLPLASFNDKHFRVISDLNTFHPYIRK